MDEKHHMERDVALTFDFLRYLVDHPEMMNEIPDGAELEFIGSDIITAESAENDNHDKKRTIISTKRVFEFLRFTHG
ncbi:MAG: hypothetical protein HYW07_11595 [Candidatus Latescibacteria bacterium]|nr:hypothetical protein [Candidatus Latescibacterota bacterium]